LENNDKLTQNPIDKDKVAESPSTLPYAHTVGGSAIDLVDTKLTKSLDMAAMHDQTGMQLDQIRKQMELLAQQAREIQKRKELSDLIYNAKMSFKPEINHVYYLYENDEGTPVLSLIGPNEWGKSKGYSKFLDAVRLLADHTWKIEPQ
jgi:hypothetical protein